MYYITFAPRFEIRGEYIISLLESFMKENNFKGTILFAHGDVGYHLNFYCKLFS